MSAKHPIIAVTGSSGAGTTTVMNAFNGIFVREKLKAQIVEGDAFHRYDRKQMRARQKEAEKEHRNFSHFGPDANILDELEALFRSYAETGTGKTRQYLHDDDVESGQEAGTFTPWTDVGPDSDLLFYEGLHGAYAD